MDTSKQSDDLSSQNSFAARLKNPFLWIVLPIPVILWVIWTNLFGASIQILPLRDQFTIEDQMDNIVPTDSSSVEEMTRINTFTKTDSSVDIKFTLGAGIEYPYAGLLFKTYRDTADSVMLNISNMDFLELELAATGGKQEVNIYYSEFIDGYTSFEKDSAGEFKKDMSWRTFEYQLAADEKMTRYRINLKEFQTNPWWFQKQGIPQHKIPASSLKKVINLVIENGNYETKGSPLSISVKNIRFGRNMTPFNAIALGLIAIYYAFVFLITKFGIRKVIGPVVIPYRQLEVSSYMDNDAKKIEEYVATNYTDPDLAVTKLCADTGIAQPKVQAILKKQYQMTFRQYLNKIRMHEAKRLLRETNRQVTDIAYLVGYKNVTHFNRIFKETEGVSPVQFRKSGS